MALLLRVLSLAVVAIAASSAQTTVVRAQRMLDVRSGRVVSPAVLVVNGGLIEAVNPACWPSRWRAPPTPGGSSCRASSPPVTRSASPAVLLKDGPITSGGDGLLPAKWFSALYLGPASTVALAR